MIRRIWAGTNGHPGTPWLLFFAGMGWVSAGHWGGALLMLAIFGPLYLWGAYDRGGSR